MQGFHQMDTGPPSDLKQPYLACTGLLQTSNLVKPWGKFLPPSFLLSLFEIAICCGSRSKTSLAWPGDIGFCIWEAFGRIHVTLWSSLDNMEGGEKAWKQMTENNEFLGPNCDSKISECNDLLYFTLSFSNNFCLVELHVLKYEQLF